MYRSFTYKFKASKRPSFMEGTNYIGVEVHMSNGNARVAFDLRVSAVRSVFCKGATKAKTDVCDGIDNNRDGLVDRDPKTRKALMRPCRDCRGGVRRCVRGAYM